MYGKNKNRESSYDTVADDKKLMIMIYIHNYFTTATITPPLVLHVVYYRVNRREGAEYWLYGLFLPS